MLLVLNILDQVSLSGYMDALWALNSLRNDRPYLVENTIQYKFAHQLLQDILFGEQTSFKCSDFRDQLPKLRELLPKSNMSLLQMQYVKIKSFPKELTFKLAQKPACSLLNRNKSILPSDTRMAYLQNWDGTDDAQYINVIWVRNLNQMNAYLAGEHPQVHTVARMWRLVYEKKVSVWSLIHSFPDEDEEFPSILPKADGEMSGKFLVSLSSSQVHENFNEYHVTLEIPNSQSRSFPPHKCVVMMMKGWPHTEHKPQSLEPLLSILDKAESIMTASKVGLFTCKDGVTGCGVMMALLHAVERIKLQQEVDIYRSVVDITYDRPDFIITKDQYDLVHEALALYLETYSHYSNFC